MSTGTGSATITFGNDTRTAETYNTYGVSDSWPNPVVMSRVNLPASITPSSIAYSTCSGYPKGVWIITTSTTTYYASEDGGNTWISRTAPASIGHIVGGNGVFIAFNIGAATVVYRTVDGINWTSPSCGASNTKSAVACAGGNNWVIHISTVGAYYSTDNGVTWNASGTAITATTGSMSLAGGNTNEFVLGTGTQAMWYTTNGGSTWTNSTFSDSNDDHKVFFVNGQFVETVGNFANLRGVSSTAQAGTSWTYYDTTLPGGYNPSNNYIRYTNGIYLLYYQTTVLISTDLLSWNPLFRDNAANLVNVYHGPGYFLGLLTDASTYIYKYVVNTRTQTTATTVTSVAKSVLGSHTASVTVTGLTAFTNTDHAEAWIMGSDSTSTHSQIEHQIAPIKLKVTNPITGVGFTINATSDYRLTGDFKVRYVYAS